MSIQGFLKSGKGRSLPQSSPGLSGCGLRRERSPGAGEKWPCSRDELPVPKEKSPLSRPVAPRLRAQGWQATPVALSLAALLLVPAPAAATGAQGEESTIDHLLIDLRSGRVELRGWSQRGGQQGSVQIQSAGEDPQLLKADSLSKQATEEDGSRDSALKVQQLEGVHFVSNPTETALEGSGFTANESSRFSDSVFPKEDREIGFSEANPEEQQLPTNSGEYGSDLFLREAEESSGSSPLLHNNPESSSESSTGQSAAPAGLEGNAASHFQPLDPSSVEREQNSVIERESSAASETKPATLGEEQSSSFRENEALERFETTQPSESSENLETFERANSLEMIEKTEILEKADMSEKVAAVESAEMNETSGVLEEMKAGDEREVDGLPASHELEDGHSSHVHPYVRQGESNAPHQQAAPSLKAVITPSSYRLSCGDSIQLSAKESQSAHPPIVSHRWEIHSGQTRDEAFGPVVEHQLSSAPQKDGSFPEFRADLHIEDQAGKRASTRIRLNVGPSSPNQAPVAKLSPGYLYVDRELQEDVILDASASSDPDGDCDHLRFEWSCESSDEGSCNTAGIALNAPILRIPWQNLAEGTSYFWKVSVVDLAGNRSSATTVVESIQRMKPQQEIIQVKGRKNTGDDLQPNCIYRSKTKEAIWCAHW